MLNEKFNYLHHSHNQDLFPRTFQLVTALASNSCMSEGGLGNPGLGLA